MSSVDPAEISKFAALAARWWDPAGPMKPLHQMNPVRVGWIDARLPRGARLLDIGCGAGLAAEALAGCGHDVLGVDAAADAIAAAEAHAAGPRAEFGLRLSYRAGAAEALLAEGAIFDAITALEVIEHVPDPAAFLQLLAGLVAPGGRVFISTLNRTLRSLAVAKIGAEYVARVLPAGTHDWRKFLPPDLLAAQARAAGLRLSGLTGLGMAPLSGALGGGAWRLTRDVGINYLAEFTR